MYDHLDQKLGPLPVANYGTAVARALEWLGDRYLLAKPINGPVRRREPASASGVRAQARAG
jgi:hypothetical protein